MYHLIYCTCTCVFLNRSIRSLLTLRQYIIAKESCCPLTLYPGGNSESNSSSERGRFLSSISLCQVYACNCSGVMDIRWPGVGVAIAIALAPVGVVPLGVMPPGVNPLGVEPPGVKPLGVDPPGVWLPGKRFECKHRSNSMGLFPKEPRYFNEILHFLYS